MRTGTCGLCVLMTILLSVVLSMGMVQARQNNAPIGNWQGTLAVSGMELRIVFHISLTADGALTATMDSPDQGAKGIPISKASFEAGHLLLEVSSIGGVYEGSLEADREHITGEWQQSGLRLPLNLEKTEKPAEVRRPQEPKPPYPYQEEEVSYPNAAAGIILAGTLTLPKTTNPVPAVVLVSGSGPQDRDETIMGHRPFRVLADFLTREGIAVLRFDDRGVGKSGGDFKTATMEDFVGDVLAGIEYLKTRKEIDTHRIGVIGHSEGGWIAPEIAVRSKNVAFIILMAAPGIPGEELLIQQSKAIMLASGMDPALIDKGTKSTQNMFEVIKSESDNKLAEEKLRQLHHTFWESLSEGEKEAYRNFGGSDELFEARLPILLSPWFRELLTYDPFPYLEKITCPVLAINGDKDLQVPSGPNLSRIEAALKKGGNSHYVVRELAGVNHLFQTAETGLPAEYAKIEETISPLALKIIGNWINRNVAETKGQ